MSIMVSCIQPALGVNPSSFNTTDSIHEDSITPIQTKWKFHPEETVEDREIAIAAKYLDESYSLKTKYLDAPMPPDKTLEELHINLNQILDRTLAIINHTATIRDFLLSQYEASVKCGNPISAFVFIGTTPKHSAGLEFHKALLAQTPELINENTEKNLMILPKDLDLRAQFTKDVTLKQLDFLKKEAEKFLKRNFDVNPSNDPSISLKLPEDKIDYVVGHFPPSNCSLMRNTAFQASVDPRSLYEKRLKITLLSRHPNTHRRAIVDTLLKIMYDDEASEKNYLAIFGLMWGFLNAKKCYRPSMLTSYLFAHINKFLDTAKWADKFAEYIHNYIQTHDEEVSTIQKFLLMLTFEVFCEKEAIYLKGLQPYVNTAFEKIFPQETICEDIFFKARKDALPTSVIALMMNASCGLMLACPSKHNPKINLTKLLNAPYIEIKHSCGLAQNFEWNLTSLCQSKDLLTIYLSQHSTLLVQLLTHFFEISVEQAQKPVLEKYKTQIGSDLALLLPVAEELLQFENEIVRFMAFSVLFQLRALGVNNAEEILCTKGFPRLLAVQDMCIQGIVLKLAQSLLFSVSPNYLHTSISDALTLSAPLNWMLAMVKTSAHPFYKFAFDLWTNSLQTDIHLAIDFIQNMLTYRPDIAIDELHKIMNTVIFDKITKRNLTQKIHLLLNNHSAKVTRWCKLYEICSHPSLNIFIEPKIKDSFTSRLIALSSSNPESQDCIQFAEEILELCLKNLWKDKCVHIIELFTSHSFKRIMPNYFVYWTKLIVLLDQQNPIKISNRNLLTFCSFAISWLNHSKNTLTADFRAYRVILFLVDKLSKTKPASPAKLYALCLSTLKHNLFSASAQKDNLFEAIEKALNEGLWDEFPLTELLNLVMARYYEILSEVHYPVFLKTLPLLLKENILDSVSFTKITEVLNRFKTHQPNTRDWVSFSNLLLLNLRHSQDSRAYQKSALIVCEQLKNDFLLEALGLELSDQKQALMTFKAIILKFNSLSPSQKNTFFSLARKLIHSSNDHAYLLDWYKNAYTHQSFNASQCLQLLLDLREKLPKEVSLSTILLQKVSKIKFDVFPTDEEEKSEILRMLSSLLDSNENIPLKLLKDIHTYFIDDPRISIHVERHLNSLINDNDPQLLIQALVDPFIKKFSLSIQDQALNCIWSKSGPNTPRMLELIQQYESRLSIELWDKLWRWIDQRGKTFISQVYSLWKPHTLLITDQVFLCLFTHWYSQLLLLYNSQADVISSLIFRPIPVKVKARAIGKMIGSNDASEEFFIEILHKGNDEKLWKCPSEEFRTFLAQAISISIKKHYWESLILCLEHIACVVDEHPHQAKVYLDLIVSFTSSWPSKTSQKLGLLLCLIVDRSVKFYPKKTILNFFPWLVCLSPYSLSLDFSDAKAIQLTLIAGYFESYLTEIPKNFVWELIPQLHNFPLVFKSPSIFGFLYNKPLSPSKKELIEIFWPLTLYSILSENIVRNPNEIEVILKHLEVYYKIFSMTNNKSIDLLKAAINMVIRRYTVLEPKEIFDFFRKFRARFGQFIQEPNHSCVIEHLFLSELLRPNGYLMVSELRPIRELQLRHFDSNESVNEFLSVHQALNMLQFVRFLINISVKSYPFEKANPDFNSELEKIILAFFFMPATVDNALADFCALIIDQTYKDLKDLGYTFSQKETSEIINYYIVDRHSFKDPEKELIERKVLFWSIFNFLSQSLPESLSKILPGLFEKLYTGLPTTFFDIAKTFSHICKDLSYTINPFCMVRLSKSLERFASVAFHLTTSQQGETYPNLICLMLQKTAILTFHCTPENENEAQYLLKEITLQLVHLEKLTPVKWNNFTEDILERIYLSIIKKLSGCSDSFLIKIFGHFLNSLYCFTPHYGTIREKDATFVRVFLTLINLLPSNKSTIFAMCLTHTSNTFLNPCRLLSLLPSDIHHELMPSIMEHCPCPNSLFFVHIQTTLLSLASKNSAQPVDKEQKLAISSIALTRIINADFFEDSLNDPLKKRIEPYAVLFLVCLVDIGYSSKAQVYAHQLYSKKILSSSKVIFYLHPQRIFKLLKYHARCVAVDAVSNAIPINVIFTFLETFQNLRKQNSPNIFRANSLAMHYWDKSLFLSYSFLLINKLLKMGEQFPEMKVPLIEKASDVVEQLLKEKKIPHEGLCQAAVLIYISQEIEHVKRPTQQRRPDFLEKVLLATRDIDQRIFLDMVALYLSCHDVDTQNIYFGLCDGYDSSPNGTGHALLKERIRKAFDNIWSITQYNMSWNTVTIQLSILVNAQTHIFMENSPQLAEKYHEVLTNLYKMLENTSTIPQKLLNAVFYFFHKQYADLSKSQESTWLCRQILPLLIKYFTSPKCNNIEIHIQLTGLLDLYLTSELLEGAEGFAIYRENLEACITKQKQIDKVPKNEPLLKIQSWVHIVSLIWIVFIKKPWNLSQEENKTHSQMLYQWLFYLSNGDGLALSLLDSLLKRLNFVIDTTDIRKNLEKNLADEIPLLSAKTKNGIDKITEILLKQLE